MTDTVITPDILRELRWLAASALTIAVVDKAVLTELVATWEASRLRLTPDPTPDTDNYFQRLHDSDKGHAERERGWDRGDHPST